MLFLCIIVIMMNKKKLTIKNARIINPKTNMDMVGDIFIEDGRVAKLIPENERVGDDFPEGEIIDAKGMIAAPGLVDIHVHFRDPGQTYKEDIETGARAAKAGGFTSVIMMANTSPAVDSPEILKEVITKAEAQPINVYASSAVSKGLKGFELVDFDEMAKAGAAGFTDDGIPLMDVKLLTKAMEEASRLKMPISLHEEDPKYIENSGVNAGSVAESLGLAGAKREAEYTLIERDIKLAIKTGAQLDIQHISTKEGVDLVRKARKDHKNIHAEATPHHFTLTEEAVLKYKTLSKMNPPVREEADRQAIIEGLKDGTIEFIATDHAPHSAEEKSREFTKAPSGIIGLETSLALGITELVKKGYLTLSDLIEKMSVNPAVLYKLDAGDISEGKIADIVIFDPNEKWTVNDFYSRSSNSPFVGWTLTGRVKYTICGGMPVYIDKA